MEDPISELALLKYNHHLLKNAHENALKEIEELNAKLKRCHEELRLAWDRDRFW